MNFSAWPRREKQAKGKYTGMAQIAIRLPVEIRSQLRIEAERHNLTLQAYCIRKLTGKGLDYDGSQSAG